MPPIHVWQPAVPTTVKPRAAKPHIRIPRIVMIDAPTGPHGRSNAQNHMVSLSACCRSQLRDFMENSGFLVCADRSEFSGFSHSRRTPGSARLPEAFKFDYNTRIARGVRLRSLRTENTPWNPIRVIPAWESDSGLDVCFSRANGSTVIRPGFLPREKPIPLPKSSLSRRWPLLCRRFSHDST